MKKAMLITVGTGEGVAHGLSYSIKQQNPDYILFLATEYSEKKTIPEILKNSKIENYDLKISRDINDIDNLYKEYEEAVNNVFRKGYKNNEIVVDFTSGTKSMSSALAIVGIFKKVGTVSYIWGTRDKGGRVISGTERMASFYPIKISIDQELIIFKHFFNTFQFESAIKVLEDIKSLGGDYKTEEIDVLFILTEGYNYWDKFNFKDSLEIFNKLRNNECISNLGLKTCISNNKEFLYKESNNEYCNERLYDLYLNAERRILEGKYDDAMARFYRLFEYLAQISLYNNAPPLIAGNINIDYLPEHLKEKYIQKRGEEEKLKLGLFGSYELLKDLNNKIGTKFNEDYKNRIQKYLSIRNDSILAHGFVPVSKENVDEMKKIIEEYLLLFNSQWEKIAKKGRFFELNL